MGNNLIVVFLWKIICAITRNIEYMEENFQGSNICPGHIHHNNHDVIIVEATMTKQKFQIGK